MESISSTSSRKMTKRLQLFHSISTNENTVNATQCHKMLSTSKLAYYRTCTQHNSTRHRPTTLVGFPAKFESVYATSLPDGDFFNVIPIAQVSIIRDNVSFGHLVYVDSCLRAAFVVVDSEAGSTKGSKNSSRNGSAEMSAGTGRRILGRFGGQVQVLR